LIAYDFFAAAEVVFCDRGGDIIGLDLLSFKRRRHLTDGFVCLF
jgi:hypothetical protein